mmetsp:Transcript_1607/g.4808  ORF Transcript_1607/g.4808 Transcript_1607/m.4808 type:complete len:102 (+) Transcript_1607:214-519(+)
MGRDLDAARREQEQKIGEALKQFERSVGEVAQRARDSLAYSISDDPRLKAHAQTQAGFHAPPPRTLYAADGRPALRRRRRVYPADGQRRPSEASVRLRHWP